MHTYRGYLALAMLFVAGAVNAQNEPASQDGAYVSLMGQALLSLDGSPHGNGGGASFIIGVRRGMAGLELRTSYASRSSADWYGVLLNGLVFPFEGMPGLYGTAGIGLSHIRNYPQIDDVSFDVTNMVGGAGYILPFKLFDHDVHFRAEVLYQYGTRNKRAQDQLPPAEDLPVETRFRDGVIQLGLHFPFGGHVAPLPVMEAPAVVPPVQQDGAEPAPSFETLPASSGPGLSGGAP